MGGGGRKEHEGEEEMMDSRARKEGGRGYDNITEYTWDASS